MAVKNLFTIEGTLYSKDTRLVPNKKKPSEPPWEFRSIKLEIKRTFMKKDGNGVEQQHSMTELPEFQLNNGLGFDDLEVKDFIRVTFAITGKQVTPTWHKTELKALKIEFAEIDSTGNPQTPRPRKAKDVETEKIFTPPVDGEDNDPYSELPF